MLATDYDAPRVRPEDEPDDNDIKNLAAGAAKATPRDTPEDEANLGEDLELPGADLSALDLTVEVVPQQNDEFVCSSCFMVHHRSQRMSSDPDVCRDCA